MNTLFSVGAATLLALGVPSGGTFNRLLLVSSFIFVYVGIVVLLLFPIVLQASFEALIANAAVWAPGMTGLLACCSEYSRTAGDSACAVVHDRSCQSNYGCSVSLLSGCYLVPPMVYVFGGPELRAYFPS